MPIGSTVYPQVTPPAVQPGQVASGGGTAGLSLNAGTTSASGTSNQTGAANSVGGYTGQQQNTYTPGQEQLQGGVNEALAGILGGGATAFSAGGNGINQDLIDKASAAYTSNYNRFVAPQLAAQGGGGSPAIGSNLALGLEQLQASMAPQLYQTQAGIFSNALGTAAGTAYTPTGQTNSGTQNSATQSTGQGNWQSSSDQMSALLSFLNL